ncbi:hypothetical protein YTPLAS18_03490 [Nitrospira sp.]|nr:hypothetical protein YTPLAS18_03490 [Nitrospira sp.]
MTKLINFREHWKGVCNTKFPNGSVARHAFNYGHHYPESLRGGAEVLDRLRAQVSTNRAQFDGLAGAETA